MKRWRRPFLIALAVAVFLAILSTLGVWITVRSMAPNKIKDVIESATSTFLGRTLTIDKLAVAPFPQWELRAEGVKLTDKAGHVLVACENVTACHTGITSTMK